MSAVCETAAPIQSLLITFLPYADARYEFQEVV